ncbi:sensor histidine kinase [Niveibacterium sp.]|uniref:sensor histidine kinase n=1 Tax=Niveibacterium sp. TaxID=2017444 RepID=UPI0035B33FA2
MQSEKMAALGSIVAGVAHELNTPIGNCLTVTSTLSEATSELVREAREGLRRSTLHEYLVTAEQASDILLRNLSRAAELVASFKQVAVDRASSNRRSFRVAEVMDETLLMLRPTLKLKPYEVETTIESDLSMDSFPGPLGQVLTNLVNNAIVHGFDGRTEGRVRIEARADGEHQIRISVRDDGIGMSEAMQRRVFDPFFTTKLGRGGSGLGMHIVHTIVTGLLGGTVELQSAEGQGTTVTLVVPKVAPPQ